MHGRGDFSFEAVAAALAMTAAVGCGGSDFDGTWAGEVQRTVIATGATATVNERWVINDQAGTLQRSRGAERCDLMVETGLCSRGCFVKVVIAGQACTLDGRTAVLVEGFLTTETSPDSISMKWASELGRDPEILETGALSKR
jgi:hypothetical protein